MPDRAEPLYTQADLDARIAAERADQKAHDVRGTQQTRIGAETIAERVAAAIVPHLRPPAPPVQQGADVPVWLKIVGAVGAAVLTGCGILAIVWQVAIGPVLVRLDQLERSRTEATATATTRDTRLQVVEGKAAQIETTMVTATRIRDQQQQAMLDQIRALSQSDQSASERLGNLANTIAGILPRLEEILRRQERLENRLGARQGSTEEQPTSLRVMPSRAI